MSMSPKNKSVVPAAETFQFADHPVRAVVREGEPWFLARDVCSVLGYRFPADGLRHVDIDDVRVVTNDGVSPGQPEHAFFSASGNLRRRISLVNESGLYSLILRSTRPEARTFKRWITREVLPTIRRTGGYRLDVPQTLPDALELAAAQARELQAQRAELAAAAPKAAAFDAYMDAHGSVGMGVVANHLGIGRNLLFARLRDAGILQQTDNRPYQRYAQHFRVIALTGTTRHGDDYASYTTRVRPSGIELIRRVLHTPGPGTTAAGGW